MAEKFKKINKEYLLTDSTVNCYGFRLLTAGYQRDEYGKNPIGYYMHKRDDGVVVRWEDFRLEGDSVYAKPVVNMSNARGQQTVDEIESGFLNAASVGHFVILEVSTDPADILPNQSGPTVTKWYNRECSLVDVPGNFNALKLFDSDENELSLKDLSSFPSITQKMKQIFFTAAQLAAMNLKTDAESAAVETAFNDLLAKATKVPALEQELVSANTAKKKAEDDLAALKAETADKDVTDQLAAAVKEGKLTIELSRTLAADYKGKPDSLKVVLSALKAYSPITTQIAQAQASEAQTSLASKTWDELEEGENLEALKAENPDAFKQKFKEKFKKDYTGK